MTTTPATVASVALTDDQARRLRQLTLRRDAADKAWRDAITDAVDAGGSLREVGEAVGLSHTAVKFIAHGRPTR